jgi:proliferating cell nuclear antigen PCNA
MEEKGGCGMLLRFRDGAQFRSALDVAKTMVTETTIALSEDGGLSFETMDTSHVSLVCLHLTRSAFDELTVQAGSPPLGVNLSSLCRILKIHAAKASVSWSQAAGQSETLSIFFDAGTAPVGSSRRRGTVATLKLIDIEQEALGIPDTVFPARIFMTSATLQHIVKSCVPIGDAIYVTVDKETITFAVAGDIGSLCIVVYQACRPPPPSIPVLSAGRHSFAAASATHNGTDAKHDNPNGNDGPAEVVDPDSWDCFHRHPVADGDAGELCAYIFTQETETASFPFTIQLSLKFLEMFVKAATLSPHVCLSLGTDVPLKLTFPLYLGPPTPNATTTAINESDADPRKRKADQQPREPNPPDQAPETDDIEPAKPAKKQRPNPTKPPAAAAAAAAVEEGAAESSDGTSLGAGAAETASGGAKKSVGGRQATLSDMKKSGKGAAPPPAGGTKGKSGAPPAAARGRSKAASGNAAGGDDRPFTARVVGELVFHLAPKIDDDPPNQDPKSEPPDAS